jgi:hypothetical protein
LLKAPEFLAVIVAMAPVVDVEVKILLMYDNL